MNCRKVWYIILAAIFTIVFALSVVFMISAIQFAELGRVFLYGAMALFFAELAILLIIKIFSLKKNNG